MTRLRFTVQCLDADSCTVYFEPEGGHVELVRDEVITIEMVGDNEPAIPEIAHVADGISVCAWAGAKTVAWDSDGNRLDI
jgi:hypothetical protein